MEYVEHALWDIDMTLLFQLVYGDAAIMKYSHKMYVLVIKDTSELMEFAEPVHKDNSTMFSHQNANLQFFVDKIKYSQMDFVNVNQVTSESMDCVTNVSLIHSLTNLPNLVDVILTIL